jgi:hypothetical protein
MLPSLDYEEVHNEASQEEVLTCITRWCIEFDFGTTTIVTRKG